MNYNRYNLREKKSYGIACCRYNTKNKKMEVLLVQKRCTYYYIEFILGHYKKNEYKRIKYFLNNMTTNEKIDILSLNFGQMWYRFCLTNPDALHFLYTNANDIAYERYIKCKKHFESIFLSDRGVTLRTLINNSKSKGLVWEIPKGRKSYPQEKELNAAMREFYEETSIDISFYKILLDISPKTLTFVSSNIKYINNYYIAILDNTDNKKYSKLLRSIRFQDPYIKINFSTDEQASEILEVKWLSLDDISIIDIDNRIYNFIKPIFMVLQKKYKLNKLVSLKLI